MALYDNPWKTAEDAIFAALCAAASATNKKGAFLGYLPPVPNVWTFKIGGGGRVENTWTAPITEMIMDADLEGIFVDREDAQLLSKKVLGILPFKNSDRGGNVQCFRLRQGPMPDVRVKEVILDNEKAPRLLWTIVLGFQVVFNTTYTSAT